MLFGKNKKKENSFISEVDDSRVLVYDFRRRTNLLFENYRAVGYKKPENYHLEQLKSELTDTLTRLINANAVDAGNEDCLIDKILAPVRSGLISLDDQSLDHLDFYHRQDGNMSAHRGHPTDSRADARKRSRPGNRTCTYPDALEQMLRHQRKNGGS